MYLLFRALGLIVLAVGVVFAVGDIARSLADETSQLLTIDQALSAMGLMVSEAVPGSMTAAVIGSWSMSITCGAVGLLFLLLGHRGHRAGPNRRRDI
ncbi:hypothetical protein LQ948_18355 [Jiella sp. MQZ9-1]|uniref:Uncharacterized protein n=1 Tax=Jiella flava TaxID=2816857 RepID=A0A939G3R8_9HYPH|nr:hypothetical protein [Jiella flava]MBO0664529.1 hypothetical protein [Jiella flava]MCD2473163.1 hypothetical protein [Jiella flava]